MKTVGIIAEYNPFHNGHAYHLTKAKELSGADYCVVIMSGNFTQRGTPAIIDKYVRTEMALSQGADLVIELPVCFATGSAEYFAYGAVSILDALHVDALCFGSECGDVNLLKKVSQILAKEPAAFKQLLQEKVKSGISFPTARAFAIAEYLGNDADKLCDILQSPNNILGVEYLKALHRLRSPMDVFTVKRVGSGYNDDAMSETAFSSATAIRKHLFSDTALTASMPAGAYSLLKKHTEVNSPVFMDDFSSMLYYKLLSGMSDGFVTFSDVNETISDKIIKSLDSFSDITSFCEKELKSKDVTMTRIYRCLLHILLDIKKFDMDKYLTFPDALYARILGFKKSSEDVFKYFNNARIPLVTKLAGAKEFLPDTAIQMLTRDIFAAHLYEGVVAHKNGGSIKNEYRRKLVILP